MKYVSEDTLVSREEGLSVLEVLISTAIMGTTLLGLSSMGQISSKLQTQSNLTIQADTFRRSLLALVQNDQAWANTVAHAPTPGLGCLQGLGQQCTTDGQSTSTAIADQAFALYDPAGTTPFYDPTSPTAGFNSAGQVCNQFDPAGNDVCPFRLELVWPAVCAAPACLNPLVKVAATVTYHPSSQGRIIAFNGANYGFSVFRGGSVGSVEDRAYSTPLSLTVTSPIVSPAYSYESGNQATDWVNMSLTAPIPGVSVGQTRRVTARVQGNINWDGCTATFINYQVDLRYSLDGGTSWTDYGPAGLDVTNGGADFSLPVSLIVNPGQSVLFSPRLRFQQIGGIPSNCVTGYSVYGVLDVRVHST